QTGVVAGRVGHAGGRAGIVRVENPVCRASYDVADPQLVHVEAWGDVRQGDRVEIRVVFRIRKNIRVGCRLGLERSAGRGGSSSRGSQLGDVIVGPGIPVVDQRLDNIGIGRPEEGVRPR